MESLETLKALLRTWIDEISLGLAFTRRMLLESGNCCAWSGKANILDHLRKRFHAKALRTKLGALGAAAIAPMAAEFAATAGKPIQSAAAEHGTATTDRRSLLNIPQVLGGR